eukprot:4980051-Prorocentrum_lima.AAC.1
MTSSLVGSEMCIRDSLCGVRRLSPIPGRCNGPEATADAWRCSGSSIPVSYTHLTLPTICSV